MDRKQREREALETVKLGRILLAQGNGIAKERLLKKTMKRKTQ